MDYAAVPNLPTLFFEQAAKLADKPFLWAKIDGAYRSTSYAQAADITRRISRGLSLSLIHI